MAPVRTILKDLNRLLSPVFGNRLRQVVLYGSVARGQDTEDSDVDVLLVLQDVPTYTTDLKKALGAVARLAGQLDRRISIKPIPLADYQSGDCPLLQSIRREGLVL
jgi:uncharacterized protein